MESSQCPAAPRVELINFFISQTAFFGQIATWQDILIVVSPYDGTEKYWE
jgi:hypothetical protein